MNEEFAIKGGVSDSELPSGGVERAGGRYGAWRAWLRSPFPPQMRTGAIALVGVLAAALVGYLSATNPAASPPHAAALMRISIILSLVAAGIYTYLKLQEQMGATLIAAGLYSAFWLLNGSSQPLLFTVGVLCSAFAPALAAYVMLAHPEGEIRSLYAQRFLTISGVILAFAWTILVLGRPQPAVHTPLLGCTPHCPANVVFLGQLPGLLAASLRAIAVACWGALTLVPPLLIARRAKSAPGRLRLALAPVLAAAVVIGIGWIGFIAHLAAESRPPAAAGAVYVGLLVLVPLAVMFGFALERLYMGRALADVVHQLTVRPHADPEPLIAAALNDPSLKIAYSRKGSGDPVDFCGSAVTIPDGGRDAGVLWIERDGTRVAAVVFDPSLADQAEFIQAAGDAAMLDLEKTRLEADLMASTTDLAASRVRLLEAADAERERIERDLHDSVQSHLLGLRVKLDLAAEAIQEEPDRGQQMIGTIGRQMEDLLGTVRSLARGIYPALLTECGLGEALKSAAREAPVPVAVRARGLARYHQDVEVAVYFCCLEAMQNIAKHAGPGAAAVIRLWTVAQNLHFEVTDIGRGFRQDLMAPGRGLTNMRDRIEAVGGTVYVKSRVGKGTSVCGVVPAAGLAD